MLFLNCLIDWNTDYRVMTRQTKMCSFKSFHPTRAYIFIKKVTFIRLLLNLVFAFIYLSHMDLDLYTYQLFSLKTFVNSFSLDKVGIIERGECIYRWATFLHYSSAAYIIFVILFQNKHKQGFVKRLFIYDLGNATSICFVIVLIWYVLTFSIKGYMNVFGILGRDPGGKMFNTVFSS